MASLGVDYKGKENHHVDVEALVNKVILNNIELNNLCQCYHLPQENPCGFNGYCCQQFPVDYDELPGKDRDMNGVARVDLDCNLYAIVKPWVWVLR